MSTTDKPEATQGAVPEAAASVEAGPRKSYRRKYRKIMVKFQQKMEESSSLFRDEQRILDISQRLAEQTDQLLDFLADFNSLPQVPKSLRFDLRSKEEDAIPQSGSDNLIHDQESGHLALRKARYQLQTGQIQPGDYTDLKDSVLQTPAFAPDISYASLTQSAHIPPRPRTEAADEAAEGANPFLSTKQEDQYLQSLDAYINGSSLNPRAHTITSLGAKTSDKLSDRDKEMQLQNPVSVYNWLRKHEPKVFLQDNEPPGDKAPRTTGSRISKRNAANRESVIKQEIKQEKELYDEDGIAIDPEAAKGKRKRDDDTGYRPKGGNSRPAKRKKEESTPVAPVRKGKKPSMDMRP